MKKLMIAVAMTIALPAAALAQAAPAPATKSAPAAHAGHNMQNMSCKDMHAQMAGGGGQMDHSKMDHSKMANGQGCGDTAKAGAKATSGHEGHKGH